MFGNRNYIYENTNVSFHLPVNVFYDCHAKYEVRIDDTALDIEINPTFDYFAAPVPFISVLRYR